MRSKSIRARYVCIFSIILLELILGSWFALRLLKSSSGLFLYFIIGVLLITAVTFLIFWLFLIKHPIIYGTSLDGLHLFKMVIFSLVGGVLLEGMTLFGAPLSSPLHLSDWHLSRIFIFSFLSIPVVLWAMLFPWRLRLKKLSDYCLCHKCRRIKEAFLFTLFLFAVALIVGLTVAAICYASYEENAKPYIVCAVIVAISITIFVKEHRKILQNPEWGFLIIILSVGLLYVVALPARTGISWDDLVHYNQANAMSYVVDAQYDDNDCFESDIQATGDDLIKMLSGEMSFEDSKNGGSSFSSDTPDSAQYNDGVYIAVDGTNDTSGSSWVSFGSIGRIPSAIGLWIGRLLHLPFAMRFGLGRLANLLFYAIVCFLALRKLKSCKLIVGAVLSLPIAIFLASNYSYDFWLNCLFAYSFCSYLKVLQSPEKNISRKDVLSILVPGVLALFVKAVMFPLLLIYLLMPSSRFSKTFTRKEYSILVILSCALLLVSFSLPFAVSLFNGTAVGDIRGGADVNSGEQVNYLLHNPTSFIQVLVNYLKDYFIPTTFISSMMITGYLRYQITFIASLVLFVFYVTLLLFDRSPCDAQYASASYRVGAFVFLLAVYLLVVLSLYVAFTPVGASNVEGVQPRYFVPCLIPLLVLCFNVRIKSKMRKDYFNCFVLSSIFVLLIFIFCNSIVVSF